MSEILSAKFLSRFSASENEAPRLPQGFRPWNPLGTSPDPINFTPATSAVCIPGDATALST